MAARDLPGLGLRAFYTVGEDGWGTRASEDLRKLSLLVTKVVLSRVSSLPDTPSAGDAHILTAEDSNSGPSGSIILWEGDTGLEEWVYYTPGEGWEVYVVADGGRYRYTGGVWTALSGSSIGAGDVTYDAEGDSNSEETNVRDALDDLYHRTNSLAARILVYENRDDDSNSFGAGGGSGSVGEAHTLLYDAADEGDSNSIQTTVGDALDDLYAQARMNFPVAVTADFTLSLAQNRSFFEVTDNSNSTATSISVGVPEEALVSLPKGYTVSFVQMGDMQVQIVAVEDSNSPGLVELIYPADMTPLTRGYGSVISIVKGSVANRWYVFGDLDPA